MMCSVSCIHLMSNDLRSPTVVEVFIFVPLQIIADKQLVQRMDFELGRDLGMGGDNLRETESTFTRFTIWGNNHSQKQEEENL